MQLSDKARGRLPKGPAIVLSRIEAAGEGDVLDFSDIEGLTLSLARKRPPRPEKREYTPEEEAVFWEEQGRLTREYYPQNLALSDRVETAFGTFENAAFDFFRPAGDEILSVNVTQIKAQDLVALLESGMIEWSAANLAPDGVTTMTSFANKIISAMRTNQEKRDTGRWN